MSATPVWDIRERSFEFACGVVRFCLNLNAKRELRSISDQLLRAGTGVASNAEEAKSAYSRRIFALKNSYALSEARESQLWLRMIVRCELSDDPDEGKRLLQECGELVGILTATVRTTRRTITAVAFTFFLSFCLWAFSF